jgi:hypothetical protein
VASSPARRVLTLLHATCSVVVGSPLRDPVGARRVVITNDCARTRAFACCPAASTGVVTASAWSTTTRRWVRWWSQTRHSRAASSWQRCVRGLAARSAQDLPLCQSLPPTNQPTNSHTTQPGERGRAPQPGRALWRAGLPHHQVLWARQAGDQGGGCCVRGRPHKRQVPRVPEDQVGGGACCRFDAACVRCVGHAH